MNKHNWLVIRDYSIAWTVALLTYSMIRNVGTIEEDGIEISILHSTLMAPFFGLLLGFVFGFTQLTFEKLYNKRTPLPKLLLFRVVLSLVVLFLVSVVAFFVFTTVLNAADVTFSEFFINPSIFIFYGYVILVDMLFSVFRQVSLMLGSGILKKLIKGEFYHPREEERIFMFLDLRSSTLMAEQLGHLKYSQMIQDCFEDLAVVTHTHAEIYQYVGDEAVLTWPSKIGLTNHNCIRAFYSFRNELDKRAEHYLSQYGHKPFFKAGLNLGQVMVAEVGKNKKEIAYHGDTINTAARIQGKCNEFERELLVSENLKNELTVMNDVSYEEMGGIPLRGKAANVTIFAVKEVRNA